MRVLRTTLQPLLLGFALLLALCWNVAHAREITRLSLDSSATGTRAEVLLDLPSDYSLLSLSGPARLVVDFKGVALPESLPLPDGAGVVKAVRTGHPVPGVTRIVFDLKAPVVAFAPRLEPTVGGGTRLVLQWPGDGASAAPAAVATTAAPPPAASQASVDPAAASAAATSQLIAGLSLPGAESGVTPALASASATPASVPAPVASEPAPPAPRQPVKTIEDVMRGATGMKPLIIAIDPGHGGQDPGAIGQHGHLEKDVVLAISLELARQINAAPGLKAYLTRDSDVFIPLNKRAKLARAAHADMFISIHANAAENRSADGSSVFVLSLRGASSQRARWLADKENASDMIGGVQLEKAGNTLASVLIDLTQSGQMKASRDAAKYVLGGLDGIGNLHKSSVEHANFAVLRTSDMPAMLVETAFISNPVEERQLADSGYQRKLAAAVLDGINTYFTRQPPPGTLYAARAAASLANAGGAAGSH